MDKNICQHCFHYRDGICFFLASDPEPCIGLCSNWKSFNEDVKQQVNKKIDAQDRVGKNRFVDRYHYDLAFGYERGSSNDDIQDTLMDE